MRTLKTVYQRLLLKCFYIRINVTSLRRLHFDIFVVTYEQINKGEADNLR